MVSTLGIFIWIIEAYGDNYLFLRTMNGNFENDGELLKILKEDSLAPQIFYFSLALFIQNIVFLYLLFTKSKKKHRLLIYYEKMKKPFIFGYLFNLLFCFFLFIKRPLSNYFIKCYFIF